jgi:hypothetical protein
MWIREKQAAGEAGRSSAYRSVAVIGKGMRDVLLELPLL